MFDLIITNATIIDGTGKEGYLGSVAVQGGKIAEILPPSPNAEAKEVIEGDGLCLCPGFIDPHSHNDLNLLFWKEGEAHIMQGVTTAICGNCGFSPAPLKDILFFGGWEYRLNFEVSPSYYNEAAYCNDSTRIRQKMKELYNYDHDYNTLSEYWEKCKKEGFSVNYYPCVGHCNLRAYVMGWDFNRTATKEEITEMAALLESCMQEGCRGFSTGLDYPPGLYCTTEEVVELCKVVKKYNGVYLTHFRMTQFADDGVAFTDRIAGVKEAIEIARQSGVRLQLSHVNPAYELKPEDSPVIIKKAITDITDLIDAANEEGLEVTFDVMPNPAAGGCFDPSLGHMLRPWLLTAGSVEQLLKNLSVPDYRAMVIKELADGKWVWASKKQWPAIETSVFITRHKDEALVNKSMAEIAEIWGVDSYEETLLRVFEKDPLCKKRWQFGITPDALKAFFAHPKCMPCSDGFSYNKDASIGFAEPLDKFPNPNHFCFAIRFLTQMDVPLHAAIHRMTGLPAQVFNLADRGVIEKGRVADLVLFNEKELDTCENYIDPCQFPEGIEYVLVNGAITAQKGAHTGALAGKVLTMNHTADI